MSESLRAKAKKHKIPYSLVLSRLAAGMILHDALTMPRERRTNKTLEEADRQHKRDSHKKTRHNMTYEDHLRASGEYTEEEIKAYVRQSKTGIEQVKITQTRPKEGFNPKSFNRY